jgi:hypothetical protein
MTASHESSWVGPLSKAPTNLSLRMRNEPSLNTLLKRGWSADRTLLYVPPKRNGYDLDIVTVGRNVNIGEDRPILWMFSTIGLCSIGQPQRNIAQAFRHIELALVLSNSESEDPFPTRLGVALAQEPHPFPGWDWSQVTAPPLMDWMCILGEELGIAIKNGSTFAIRDTLTFGPGNSQWTRSKLNRIALLPSNPHMQLAGFSPFNQPATSPDGLTPERWHTDPGTDSHTHGFYWTLPINDTEYTKANTEGTWNMFADLVQRSHQLGGDDFDLAYDLLR